MALIQYTEGETDNETFHDHNLTDLEPMGVVLHEQQGDGELKDSGRAHIEVQDTGRSEYTAAELDTVLESARLLVKLYFLRRHDGYIRQHEDFYVLADWLFPVRTNTRYWCAYWYHAPVVCRTCLAVLGRSDKGGVLKHGCLDCKGFYRDTKIDDYELSILQRVMSIDMDLLITLVCETIHDLDADNGDSNEWKKYVAYRG